jgi:hypothetical protein
VCGINALDRRTALPSLERKLSVRSPDGGSPAVLRAKSLSQER